MFCSLLISIDIEIATLRLLTRRSDQLSNAASYEILYHSFRALHYEMKQKVSYLKFKLK